MELLKVTNDYVFKKLFGSEKNKDILIDLLNSIIDPAEDKIITDVTLENNELTKEDIEDKTSILDISAKLKNGDKVNIEMQCKDEKNIIPRTLYYWSKLFTRDLKSGDDCDELTKTISINFLNFNYLPSDKYHNVYSLKDQYNRDIPESYQEIHFIELKKFSTKDKDLSSKISNDKLAKWGTFILDPHNETIQNNKTVDKAIDVLEMMSTNREIRYLAERREDNLLRYENKLKKAQEEGLEQGIQQGIQQGLEQGIEQGKIDMVKSLLIANVDINIIQTTSGFTMEQIEAIRKTL